MNKQRRNELQKIVDQIDSLKANLETLRDECEGVQAEEQDAFDNMPESLQQAERGERAQEALDQLQTAYDNLDSAVTSIQDAIEAIGEAQN